MRTGKTALRFQYVQISICTKPGNFWERVPQTLHRNFKLERVLYMAEEQNNHIILADESGVEHGFELIDMLEIDEEQYAILLPDEAENNEAVILKIGEEEDGEKYLYPIEDEDEWEMVAKAWQEFVAKDLQ